MYKVAVGQVRVDISGSTPFKYLITDKTKEGFKVQFFTVEGDPGYVSTVYWDAEELIADPIDLEYMFYVQVSSL